MAAVGFPITEEADLLRLQSTGVREGRELDYKLEGVGGADDEKREFLSDVVSFANSAGGHRLLGVEENDGLPTAFPGLHGIQVDTEILRLESLIRDGIAPRLTGVAVAPVTVSSGGIVLVIRIPRSWSLPHMVTYKNLSRFYSRNSAGKYQLDIGELRDLFELSGTVMEHARKFRVERIARVLEAELPIELEEAPRIVLHMIPFEAFLPGASHDISQFGRGRLPMPLYGGVSEWRHNFDGFLSCSRYGQSSTVHSYVQIFRNGCLEAVEAGMLTPDGKHLAIPCIALIEELYRAVAGYIEFMVGMGVVEPVAVAVSLLGVRGYRITREGVPILSRENRAIDRDNLLIPEVVLDELDFNQGRFMRLIFDALWNAAGWPECWYFNADGIYERKS